MSIQGKLQRSSGQDHIPLSSNVGLVAGLAMAVVGFIAIFVWYL